MKGKKEKLGFLGAGNMATALIKGLIQSGLHGPEQLLASDKDPGALEKVSRDFGVGVRPSNEAVVQESGVVVLCVKPQIIKDVLEEIKGVLTDDHLLISIAAGIPRAVILEALDRPLPLIRVMPNTPALVQKGVSALAGGRGVTREHMATAMGMFQAVGEAVEVEEAMMDAVTALSGSGPGYVFRIMECLVEAGVAVGLQRDISESLVLQTFVGAASLAKESGEPLSRLREKVTSPGGTTAAGLDALDKGDLEALVIKAVKAAWQRSIELGKG